MKYFIGNWKMFGVSKSANIIKKIIDYVKKDKKKSNYKVVIAPPYTLLQNFSKNFNSFDFNTKNFNKLNNNNVLYLKNIDGKNLVNAIYLCKDVIAPESGITHIGSFLNKNTLLRDTKHVMPKYFPN